VDSFVEVSSRLDAFLVAVDVVMTATSKKIRVEKNQACSGSVAKYSVFQKQLYNSLINVTVWRVLRKPLPSKAYTRHTVTFGILL
jgi:hypothetical protein